MRFWQEVLVGLVTNAFIWGAGVALHNLSPFWGFVISGLSTTALGVLWHFRDRTETISPRLNLADFVEIDQKHSFTIYELAAYWVGEKANLPLSKKAMEQFKKFEVASKSLKLKITSPNVEEAVENAYNFHTRGVMPKLNPYWIVYRDAAMIYANSVKEKPAFLYKQNRAHG